MRLAKLVTPIPLLLCACSTVQLGRDFDLSAFDAKVQRGVTTQADVRAWLGAPTSTGVSVEASGDRFSERTYYDGSGHLPDMSDARLKVLQIRFDQQGVVRAYNWSGDQK
jgi:hypothetical protein